MVGFLCFLASMEPPPWAADASESAGHLLGAALGSYSSRILSDWSVPEGFDAVEAAARMPDVPDVWTDGSLVLDKVTGVSSSGSVFFAHQSEFSWSARRWGHVDHVRPVGGEGLSCKGFCSVPGLYRLFRGPSYGVSSWPFSLLMLCIWRLTIRFDMLDDCWTVVEALLRLSLSMMVIFFCSLIGCFFAEGHADEGMVLDGRVRELDRVGNNAADEAADFGRRRVGQDVCVAWRCLSGVCGSVVSYPSESAQVLDCNIQGCG